MTEKIKVNHFKLHNNQLIQQTTDHKMNPWKQNDNNNKKSNTLNRFIGYFDLMMMIREEKKKNRLFIKPSILT